MTGIAAETALERRERGNIFILHFAEDLFLV
jgi:hypothetical protein